jgi:hypothetical protein
MGDIDDGCQLAGRVNGEDVVTTARE